MSYCGKGKTEKENNLTSMLKTIPVILLLLLNSKNPLTTPKKAPT